ETNRFTVEVSICSCTATTPHRSPATGLAWVSPDEEAVDAAIVVCRRARGWNLLLHWRKRPQIGDHRSNVLLVHVRQKVPDHTLPMKLPSVAANSAADGARDLLVTPFADPRFRIRCNVFCIQRPERLPADLVSTAPVDAVAEGTGGNLE